jgi:hypothetical protein
VIPNLLALTQEALGGDFSKLAGSFLRETQDATQSALDLLLPVVIGSLAQKGASTEGVADLSSLVGGARLDAGLLENIEGLFTGPVSRVNDLLKVGTSRLVPALFGNTSAALVNAISTTSGIRRSSATTLVAMIVPIVLTVLKQQVRDRRLAASPLSSLLRSQRANVRFKLDARIAGALGFAGPAEFLDGSSGQSQSGVAGADAGLRSRADSIAPARPDAMAVAVTATQSRRGRWLPWRSLGSD